MSQLSAHGISQARIPELIAIFFSRGSYWPRDWTWVSCVAGRFFTTEPLGKFDTTVRGCVKKKMHRQQQMRVIHWPSKRTISFLKLRMMSSLLLSDNLRLNRILCIRNIPYMSVQQRGEWGSGTSLLRNTELFTYYLTWHIVTTSYRMFQDLSKLLVATQTRK